MKGRRAKVVYCTKVGVCRDRFSCGPMKQTPVPIVQTVLFTQKWLARIRFKRATRFSLSLMHTHFHTELPPKSVQAMNLSIRKLAQLVQK